MLTAHPSIGGVRVDRNPTQTRDGRQFGQRAGSAVAAVPAAVQKIAEARGHVMQCITRGTRGKVVPFHFVLPPESGQLGPIAPVLTTIAYYNLKVKRFA